MWIERAASLFSKFSCQFPAIRWPQPTCPQSRCVHWEDVRKRHPPGKTLFQQELLENPAVCKEYVFPEIWWVHLFFLQLLTLEVPLNKSSWFKLKTTQQTLVKHVFILCCIVCQVWMNLFEGPGNHKTSTTRCMMVENEKAVSFWTKCTSLHINYFISISSRKGRRHSLLKYQMNCHIWSNRLKIIRNKTRQKKLNLDITF